MKSKLLITTALCGIAIGALPIAANAAITTTTTTTHTYDFPGAAPTINSSSSTVENCPVHYNDSSSSGGSSDDGRTGGGWVDTDGDGRGDTWSGNASPGRYNSSETRGGYASGNTNVTSSGWVSGSHNDGYDGRSNNNNSSSGSSSSGSSGSSSGGGSSGGGQRCFVTTAVMGVVGEADNGPTLTNLRRLRDAYTLHTPDGQKRVGIYYAIAPEIVDRVQKSSDADKIWMKLHQQWIDPIKRLIEEGRWEEADARYMQMMKTMVWQYFVLDDRPVSNDIKQILTNRLNISWA